MKEIKEIFYLLKTGVTTKEHYTILETIKFLIKLIVLLIASYIFVFMVFKVLKNYGVDIPRPDRFDEIRSWSAFKIILYSTILAPILEELNFRLPLRYSKINFSILIGFIVYLLLRIVLNVEYEKPISYGLGVLICIIIYKLVSTKGFTLVSLFWKNNPLFIFYFFLFAFSLLHLGNHSKITLHLMLISPLLLLPKIIAGVFLSYARLKTTVISSIILHMLNNGIMTIFLLSSR